ncbi:hypothetical protein SO802_007725 [Lithocarpus litseifolius]|uniref:Uncharacterized protein n=1 Tax=Lithocarpus litseifolius TaxID=425828 RepID=A0AAW2DS34_9ROSI
MYLSQNPFRSGATSSSDPTPSNPTPSSVWFRDDKARQDFSKTFSRHGIHSKRQVVLSDFFDTDLPTVIYSRGWESLCDIRVTCPFMIIEEFYSNMHGFDTIYLISSLTLEEYIYKDTVTHDKHIFPSAITRIPRHEYVSYPESPHFIVIGAISAATIRQSKAQLRPKRPLTETATSLASSAPSTSAPSSSAVGVTLKAVMAQLQCMDASLNTLTTKLYQAHLGGFIESPSPSPSPEAIEDEDDDGDFDSDANTTVDKDANSFGDDEMTASQRLTLCHS